MRMLPDNPISDPEEDQFGFDFYASLLADSIINTPDLPFCMGVFGAWGTGKTSLMRMIGKKLQKKKNIRTMWFNPWKYDRQEILWSALIQSVLYEIAQCRKQNAANKARKLATSTGWLLLKKGISTATAGFVSGHDLEKLKAAFCQEDELYYRHINQFEQDFEQVVGMFTGGGRLVIFIDDLDRCLPENAITVFESLKLFVGSARCIFVMAMDPFLVEQGIRSRYGETLKMSGRDYLDKIIQIPFFLPQVPFQKLREAVSVAKTAEYDERIWRLLEFALAANPRKTIRFVNCFYLLRQIVESRAAQPDRHVDRQLREDSMIVHPADQLYYLAKLLVLQLSFDKFYSYLEHHPEAWRVFEIEIIGAPSLEERQKVFKHLPGIEEFWNDQRFRVFMERTSAAQNMDPRFLSPPPPAVVSALLRAVNIVGRVTWLSETPESK